MTTRRVRGVRVSVPENDTSVDRALAEIEILRRRVAARQSLPLDSREVLRALDRASHILLGVDEVGAGYYTIASDDVGRPLLRAWGRSWSVTEFIGRILPGDVGKRVYKVATNDGSSEILQVENDEQRDRRLARGR